LKNTQTKYFTFPILLIILPNALSFAWRGSPDILIGYNHPDEHFYVTIIGNVGGIPVLSIIMIK